MTCTQLDARIDFQQWVRKRQTDNIILRGTSYHLDDNQLHLLLDSLLDLDLHACCTEKNVFNLVNSAKDPETGAVTDNAKLNCWIEVVGCAAEHRSPEYKRLRDHFGLEEARPQKH